MAVMLECCGRLSGLRSAFNKRFQVVLSQCVCGLWGCSGSFCSVSSLRDLLVCRCGSGPSTCICGILWSIGWKCCIWSTYLPYRGNFQFLYVLYVLCICMSLTVPNIDPAFSHASISPTIYFHIHPHPPNSTPRPPCILFNLIFSIETDHKINTLLLFSRMYVIGYYYYWNY